MAPDSGRAAGRGPTPRRESRALCSSRFEEDARRDGHALVAGVDEVGRGALCGPVVAAAVVLGQDFDPEGIDDSKRLTRRQRERLCQRIRAQAAAWALGSADETEIDRLNILRATHLAMRRALLALPRSPDFVLVDGLPVPTLGFPQRAVVHGDALSVSIAAASILAKVTRDAEMIECDARFPGYGLGRNMGYASRDHRDALRRLGPSRIHRRSFHGTQPWLF